MAGYSHTAPRYYVAIDRDDGSRTYKGPMVHYRAMGEIAAWRSEFPTYNVALVPADQSADEAVAEWERATIHGDRFYPLSAAIAVVEDELKAQTRLIEEDVR